MVLDKKVIFCSILFFNFLQNSGAQGLLPNRRAEANHDGVPLQRSGDHYGLEQVRLNVLPVEEAMGGDQGGLQAHFSGF